MSNRLFQDMINKMQEAVGRIIGVVDRSLTIIACSDVELVGTVAPELSVFNEPDKSIVNFARDRRTFALFGQLPARIRDESDTDTEVGEYEYAVFVDGVDSPAGRFASVLAISLENIKQYYDEKYDKLSFIKNVILENVLPGDITTKAKEFRFFNDVEWVVIFVKVLSSDETSPYELICNIFPDRNKDFVLNITDGVVLIKETQAGSKTTQDFEKLAATISDTLSSELMIKTNIGIGTAVTTIKDFARSFKEARIAVEVGKIFDTDETIVSYESLGIARLIYHLPNSLCETFLSEVFKNGSIDSLDRETLYTIQHFFDNNLNVSETSRKLFVHRNTLVYRLDKISKLTGLDLRKFDHAIVFKIALMVKKYITTGPTKF